MPTGAQVLFGAGAALFLTEFMYLSTYFHKLVYRFLENALYDWNCGVLSELQRIKMSFFVLSQRDGTGKRRE